MRIYIINLPKKKSICKYVNNMSKIGMIGLQVMFFAGCPKAILVSAVIVNSIISSVTEHMIKSG